MKQEKGKMQLGPIVSSASDSYKVKYEKLGSDQLIAQLRQNEELPKGSIFRVDLPELAHPISMRAGTSDLWVFDQIFLYKEMETDFGQDVAFIIDAGANIGLTSAYLANRFPNAQILALEVDQQNFELLAANTRPYPRVTPLLKGLWHRGANLVIDNPEDYAWAFTVSEAGQKGSSTVEGISVADLLRDFGWERVDLLKMDIEGAELEVLSHGTEEWLDRVRVLAVEFHFQRIGCWEVFCRIKEQGQFALKWCGEYAVLNSNRGHELSPVRVETLCQAREYMPRACAVMRSFTHRVRLQSASGDMRSTRRRAAAVARATRSSDRPAFETRRGSYPNVTYRSPGWPLIAGRSASNRFFTFCSARAFHDTSGARAACSSVG